MKIIQYRESYSSLMFKKRLRPFLWSLGLMGFVLFLTISVFFVPWFHNHILLIFGVFFISFVLLKPIIENLADEVRNFRHGKEGEEKVLNILNETLDDNYIYIPNYTVPNTRIGDIDGLLIGPKGIIILEIKNWIGCFRISGTDVYRRLRGTIYKLYKKSPFKQTARQQKYLTKFLKEKGIYTRIIPIIVLVCGNISSISGKTEIFITQENNLTNHIFKLISVPEYSLETIGKILEALSLPNN